MPEGFIPDEQLDPTPIVPLPDLATDRRKLRARRRSRLLVLWAGVLLLLVLQAALAMHWRRTRRAVLERPAAPPVVATRAPSVGSAATPATRPSSPATRPAVARHPVQRRPAWKRPATRTHAPRPAPGERPSPLATASGRVDDVIVPARLSGDASRGEPLFRMGCGLCHKVSPARFSARQWTAFFARGLHARHEKLRSHFTRSELADVKAFLVSSAERR